jgi:hypothetical protein
MPRRKKIIEEEQNEQPVIVDAVEEPVEEVIPATCSQGYDFEIPNDISSLLVDGGTLVTMLAGVFRPYQKYDQVVYQAENSVYFSLYLAFRAVRPGGLFWVRPELAGMNMFRDCPQVEMGGMVRITKK